MAVSNRLRWTSISSPGVVGESSFIPDVAAFACMQAMPGPEAVLAIEPDPVPAGGPLELRMMGAFPASPFLVYLTAIDGAPVLIPALVGLTADAAGEFATSAPVGPGWSGHTAQFTGIALDPAFQVVFTLPVEVAFL